ncbi:STAS domain-containing protein [Streptomyces mirabilis]|uniref:STAS domain-containing protein n=1 Tax=Streptomyces mirabilis TaxID=68239 RepID=UPI00363F27D9
MGDDGCGIAADEALGRLSSQPLTNRPALGSQPATLRAPRGNGVLPGSPSVSPASAVEEVLSDTHEAAQPGLSIGHEAVDDIRVVVLRGEIDHDNRDSVKEAALRPEGAPTPRTVAGFRGVRFMDSSGINVLIAAHRTVEPAARGNDTRRVALKVGGEAGRLARYAAMRVVRAK